MTIATNINLVFKKLNDDPSYQHKPGGIGRERSAVIDIVITTEDLSDSTVGQFALDLSGTGLNFTQVYFCDIIESDDKTDLYQFTTGAGADASLGVIDVKELTTGLANSTASYTATLKALIRGI